MKVAINTLSHVTGGGITYFENVLPRLAGDEHKYVVLVPSDRGKISRIDADNIQFIETSFPTHNILLRLVYEQFIFPMLLWFWDIDVLLSPADLTPLLAPCPAVLAIRNPNPYFDAHDLERTLYRRLKFRIQRYMTWLSARKANRVFFVSEFSKEVANTYLNIDSQKMSVIYHGIDRSLFEDPQEPSDPLRRRIEASKPYLLCVSTIYEHKNYETLLYGYAQLSEQHRSKYDLLIAGKNAAPTYFQKLKTIVTENNIEEHVVFLGEVDYQYIPYLYENAAIYVFPSKLETFGHTLVEAMASGLPVVAADATCIPEITNGAAELFEPDDPADLTSVIDNLLSDDGRRDTLTTKGKERASDFSWDRTVEQTKTLMEAASQE